MTTDNSTKISIEYWKRTKMPDLGIMENQYNVYYNDTLTEESSDIDEIVKSYNPFHITNFQIYQPIYNIFFQLTEKNYQTITWKAPTQIHDLFSVILTDSVEEPVSIQQNIFIKYSPLLDPIRYLIGKYEKTAHLIRKLPTFTDNECHPKYNDVNNASYIDSFFCFLSSKLSYKMNFPHSVEYYGSFLGIQELYKMDITDDLEYLTESDFFKNNLNKLYNINGVPEYYRQYADTKSSKTNRQQKLVIDEDYSKDVMEITDIIDLDIDDTMMIIDANRVDSTEDEETEKNSGDSSVETEDMENYAIYQSEKNNSSNDDDDSDDDDSDDDYEFEDEENSQEQELYVDDVTEEDNETESENSSDFSSVETDETPKVVAYIHDFPIQMICLERCDGTLDELFENNMITEEIGSAFLFQIILTLITYQKYFQFTHNDLHTNNIMYKNTDIEFLYYQYNNEYYRVPTYGKIMKIIDFGRSIYKYKGKVFCSDSFSSSGDASTQYNFPPYYNKKRPLIEPNYSFDLCRLGCSIYDFIIDEPNPPFDELDELQKIIYTWCLDDRGRNVLYKKNGEERYPNFKLYKMIAKNVHYHTPEKQLTFSVFSQYKVDIDNVENMNIFVI